MEAAGYGFHHQSDDGKYLIMGNGSRAFAIRNEEAQEHAAPEKMAVLVVEPRKEPYLKEIDPGLHSLQAEVGGDIAASYPFSDPVGLVCNDEGKLIGLELNRGLRDKDGNLYDIMAGIFLVLGLGEESFASLPPELVQKYMEHFKQPENIRLGRYASFGNRRAYISYPPQMPQELSDWFRPFHKTSHIYKLYLHYCYLLGYLPKHTDYKPTSPYLKEDLRKLDELSQQVRYMGKYGIETFDDLYAEREKLQRDMDALIVRRTKLQNRIRRAAPAEKETLRQEKAGITEQITTLRKQLKLNKAIEVRSAKIQEKTDLLYANEYRAKEAQQQKKAQRRERDAR